MNIVVCIKQVPDVDDIKWTKENNLDRAQMLSKLNLYDQWALDYAIKIKNNFKQATLTVISMGPNQAKEILNYALAKGATRAILLSDKFFSASDTLITAKILAQGIRKYLSDFDLILTGQMAQDGDTAQVPVSLAQELDIIDVINVEEIYNADKNMAIVSKKSDFKTEMIEVKTPCLLAIKKVCSEVYTPKIDDYIRAQDTQIETYNMEDLGFTKEEVGILGSPTTVFKAFRPTIQKETKTILENEASEILNLVKKAQ